MKRMTKKSYLFYLLSLCFGILAIVLVGLFVKNQDKMTIEWMENTKIIEPFETEHLYYKFKVNKKAKLIRYTVYELENSKWKKVGEKQQSLERMTSGILEVAFNPFKQTNVHVTLLRNLGFDKQGEVQSILAKSKYTNIDKFFEMGSTVQKEKIEYGKEIPCIVRVISEFSEKGYNGYDPDVTFERPQYYNDKQYKEVFLMTICFE